MSRGLRGRLRTRRPSGCESAAAPARAPPPPPPAGPEARPGRQRRAAAANRSLADALGSPRAAAGAAPVPRPPRPPLPRRSARWDPAPHMPPGGVQAPPAARWHQCNRPPAPPAPPALPQPPQPPPPLLPPPPPPPSPLRWPPPPHPPPPPPPPPATPGPSEALGVRLAVRCFSFSFFRFVRKSIGRVG